jgi:hypothetical protein
MCRSVLEAQPQISFRFTLFKILGSNLSYRGLRFGRLEDLDESVAMFKAVFEEDYPDASDRFFIAWMWASVARRFRHPSTEAAYQSDLSVMQSSLAVGPTVQMQHTIFENLGPKMQMTLEYTSFPIGRGQLELAVETLEQGRVLLWSEMRRLRISLDQLRRVDPTLADKLMAVIKDLEAVALSISPSPSLRDDSVTPLDTAGGHEETDTFTHVLHEQRVLMQERQAITPQIREIPGFEYFLMRFPYDTLRHAASGGPIIIINHCRWCCDTVVVLHNAPPYLIPTSRQFYDRITAMENTLLDARNKYALESREYDRVLRTVLEDLYKLVGRPVIDRLRKLRIPRQSRVWWCPTSGFCSLSLHAMGPIPSKKQQNAVFL